MSDTGVVNIHGKEYQTVALRVRNFRSEFPTRSIVTEIIYRDAECVVMKAAILDAGTVIGTGHAEEYRDTSKINQTSALENCETSAIGRALAAAGFGGTEFASADELKRAIVDKQPASKPNTALQACRDEYDRMSEEEQQFLTKLSLEVIALVDEGRLVEAWDLCSNNLEREEQLALWGLFDSKQRSALNKGKDQKKEAA